MQVFVGNFMEVGRLITDKASRQTRLRILGGPETGKAASMSRTGRLLMRSAILAGERRRRRATEPRKTTFDSWGLLHTPNTKHNAA